MLGAYRKITLAPRYCYRLPNGDIYGTFVLSVVLRVPPIAEAGVYALEPTAAQNHYDDTVWVTDAPYITI